MENRFNASEAAEKFVIERWSGKSELMNQLVVFFPAFKFKVVFEHTEDNDEERDPKRLKTKSELKTGVKGPMSHCDTMNEKLIEAVQGLTVSDSEDSGSESDNKPAAKFLHEREKTGESLLDAEQQPCKVQ